MVREAPVNSPFNAEIDGGSACQGLFTNIDIRVAEAMNQDIGINDTIL